MEQLNHGLSHIQSQKPIYPSSHHKQVMFYLNNPIVIQHELIILYSMLGNIIQHGGNAKGWSSGNAERPCRDVVSSRKVLHRNDPCEEGEVAPAEVSRSRRPNCGTDARHHVDDVGSPFLWIMSQKRRRCILHTVPMPPTPKSA